jgi:SAM-dependent methyltransferase
LANSASAITDSRLGFESRKPGLAELYREWYLLQLRHLAEVKGEILELGSGAGFIQEVIPTARTSELLPCEGVDLSLNAFEVGDRFGDKLSNLLMANVFHHICDAGEFLRSASKALVPGGRLIMVEPWLNVWSSFCYRLVGHEPFVPDQRGWSFASTDPLFDSNQAQAWIVFSRDKQQFKQAFPEFRIVTLRSIMPFSYLLSGGHSVAFGLPAKGIKLCRALERRSPLDRHLGMFALIVVEKIS